MTDLYEWIHTSDGGMKHQQIKIVKPPYEELELMLLRAIDGSHSRAHFTAEMSIWDKTRGKQMRREREDEKDRQLYELLKKRFEP